jgi:hypothetical protein
MKHGVLIAVAAISMAGAASANLFTTSSHGAASSPPPAVLKAPAGEAPQLASGARLAAPRTEPAAKSTPAPVERKASLEFRQAPVPLQVKSRPPIYLPAADITEAYAKGEAGHSAITSAPSATGDQSSENAARAAIEADGYKGVQVLRKGVNGVWHAKAMRGKTEVLLAVDSRGSVTTGD